jgi:hypothetical protein
VCFVLDNSISALPSPLRDYEVIFSGMRKPESRSHPGGINLSLGNE